MYAFAYALDALKSAVCPTWKGVCPAMSSYDGGEFYKKYLLAVDFKGKLTNDMNFKFVVLKAIILEVCFINNKFNKHLNHSKTF